MGAAEVWQIGIGLLVGIVLIRPFHILVHELGHAAAVLVFTTVTPTIQMGHGPLRQAARLGRVRFRLGSEGRLQAECGYESTGVARHARLAIAGAGPFFSLIAMIGCLLIGTALGASWLQGVLLGSAWVNARIFMTSAWPKPGTRPSDGAQIRELLDRSVI